MKTMTLLAVVMSASGCVTSSHAVQPSALGRAARSSELLSVIDAPGPLTVESVASCDWAVTRAGLVNLDHAKAKAAGLTDGDEPIKVFFHVVRHPTKGTFVIDTGVERALRDAPEKAAVRGMVASAMHVEKMKVHVALGDFVEKEQHIDGVLLTHLHLDHVTGMPDVPKGTPIYTGPGETKPRALLNMLVAPNIDRALEGQEPLSEWQFAPDADGRFDGVIDVFGDGSLWAVHVPGHTPGSTAYVARTARGPVLLVGDTSHTAWGWENGVEPGSFTADQKENAVQLARLKKLAEEHPAMQVRLGHQELAAH